MVQRAATVIVEVPGLRLHNPLNTRVHWRVLSKRGKAAKTATAFALECAGQCLTPPTVDSPWLVTITRIGVGQLDDDNLAASAKHVRDAVAAWCGVDDKHRNIVRYRYAQERSKAYGVRIEIMPRQLELKEG